MIRDYGQVIKESEAHNCDLQGDLVNGTDHGG